jgi:mannosyltransferase OCH1-like enzyme
MKSPSIPKIIHQTYKSKSLAKAPGQFRKGQNAVKQLHPDFDYRLYDDADMEKIIGEFYPDYHEPFMALPRMILKIDMFRCFLLHLYGGLYVDLDYLFHKKFDLLGHAVVLPVNRECPNGSPRLLGNSLMASVKGHPFWLTLMDTLFSEDRTQLKDAGDMAIATGSRATGSGLLYHKWKEYKGGDIFTPPRRLFHPHLGKYSSTAYGRHLGTGVWKGKRL